MSLANVLQVWLHRRTGKPSILLSSLFTRIRALITPGHAGISTPAEHLPAWGLLRSAVAVMKVDSHQIWRGWFCFSCVCWSMRRPPRCSVLPLRTPAWPWVPPHAAPQQRQSTKPLMTISWDQRQQVARYVTATTPYVSTIVCDCLHLCK